MCYLLRIPSTTTALTTYTKLVSLYQRPAKSIISVKNIIVVIAAVIVMEYAPNTSVLLSCKFERKQHKNYQMLLFNLFKEKQDWGEV